MGCIEGPCGASEFQLYRACWPVTQHFAAVGSTAGRAYFGFIFGGSGATVPLWRRPSTGNTVCSWGHDGSETTAAATGAVGTTRRDPMAMLPFCGYNMADYFPHWLDMGKRIPHPPKIFHVNWFRKGADGKFLWPGFGENVRVLKWILERVEGKGEAEETPIGYVPTRNALTLDGLKITHEAMHELFRVDPDDWEIDLAGRAESFSPSLAIVCPKKCAKSRTSWCSDWNEPCLRSSLRKNTGCFGLDGKEKADSSLPRLRSE